MSTADSMARAPQQADTTQALTVSTGHPTHAEGHMAQIFGKADAPITGPIATGGQNHFLQHTSYSGNVFPGGALGHSGLDHSVFVFDRDKGLKEHVVVFSLAGSGFGLQEYLTATEARTLAQALLMAASFSESPGPVMQRFLLPR